METTQPAHLGFAHFIAQADTLAHVLLVILLAMSVITWYLIVSKTLAYLKMKKHAQAFLAHFWEAPHLAAVADYLQKNGVTDPLSQPVDQGRRFGVLERRTHGPDRLARANGSGCRTDATAGNPHPRRRRTRLPQRCADHIRRRARRADQTGVRHRSPPRTLIAIFLRASQSYGSASLSMNRRP
ncbi:MAG: hypothetical protein ACUVT2_03440 [Thiobacillaceae bacterium]